jgi:hypothetical protein
MTDLNYKIIGSNEIREKLYKKLRENKNYVLILNLDEILREKL